MRTILTPVIAAGLILAGCSSNQPEQSTDGRLQVVASFYPLAEAAGRVAGDHADVENLTPPGVEPHDFELSPSQVETILDADLVIYLGGGFQPALEESLTSREGPSSDLLEAILGLDEGRADPHLWLDPVLFIETVEEISSALSALDPDRAGDYAAGAEAYQADLATLDHAFEATLGDCERDLIVTGHDAFGRLAARYGLRVEAIAGISPESEPSPSRLDELAQLVEDEGVTTIFTEELVSPEVAETLAREAGVQTEVLSPLEGLTSEALAAGEDYVSVMESNLEALAEALGCR